MPLPIQHLNLQCGQGFGSKCLSCMVRLTCYLATLLEEGREKESTLPLRILECSLQLGTLFRVPVITDCLWRDGGAEGRV